MTDRTIANGRIGHDGRSLRTPLPAGPNRDLGGTVVRSQPRLVAV